MSDPRENEEPSPPPAEPATLAEVARSYLRLGLTAFGGPAAHLAFMRSELVVRRRWVGEQELLDLIGGASLLPGPTSTEVALMLARRRKGWWALLIGGACFIMPSVLLVLFLSWAYVHYGTTNVGTGVLFGVKPVVVAIISNAVVGLARTAVKSWLLGAVAALAVAAYFYGTSPVLILVGAALVVTVVANRDRWMGGSSAAAGSSAAFWAALHLGHRAGSPSSRLVSSRLVSSHLAKVSLWAIFLEFLKLGSIVFGSGYVLVTYLRGDLVLHGHWLSETQLLATVAIGQITPGPVFTTATSIGYLVGGLGGALLATVGIFLPSFLLVAALMPVLSRARRSVWSASALDGVNAAAIALMTGVTIQLGRASLVGWLPVLVAVGSLALLVRWRVNSTWLVVAGAAVGLVHSFV
jgi:chromate transporter